MADAVTPPPVTAPAPSPVSITPEIIQKVRRGQQSRVWAVLLVPWVPCTLALPSVQCCLASPCKMELGFGRERVGSAARPAYSTTATDPVLHRHAMRRVIQGWGAVGEGTEFYGEGERPDGRAGWLGLRSIWMRTRR
jgi:hypothetical protein